MATTNTVNKNVTVKFVVNEKGNPPACANEWVRSVCENQRAARKQDNTVLLNSAFVPWTDQWPFLASIRKIARLQAEQIVEDAERRGRILREGELSP